jgi:hypothetical protein
MSWTARHTASATSLAFVTAVGCVNPANTSCAKDAYASGCAAWPMRGSQRRSDTSTAIPRARGPSRNSPGRSRCRARRSSTGSREPWACRRWNIWSRGAWLSRRTCYVVGTSDSLRLPSEWAMVQRVPSVLRSAGTLVSRRAAMRAGTQRDHAVARCLPMGGIIIPAMGPYRPSTFVLVVASTGFGPALLFTFPLLVVWMSFAAETREGASVGIGVSILVSVLCLGVVWYARSVHQSFYGPF